MSGRVFLISEGKLLRIFVKNSETVNPNPISETEVRVAAINVR
jgi:hypothetical protein